MEHYLTKSQLIELYLNKVYLGADSFGVSAAAERLFNKPLNQLSLDEIALIAGLIKAPASYDPIRSPILAVERRNQLLAQLWQQGEISAEAHQKAREAALVITLVLTE